MKKFRIILIMASVLLVLLIVAGLFVGNFFYNMALNPSADRSAIMGAEHNAIEYDEEAIALGKENYAWFEKQGYTDQYQTSADGLKLHAFQVLQEKPSSRWAILAHGYTGSGIQMIGSGRNFYDMGFNFLMPDARGHGESEGAYIGMGWHDRLDIVGWINQIIAADPNAEIVLYGVSMGGATVMMVSGEDLPSNVKAIVEDCGYTSAKDEFAYQLKQAFNLPAFPVINFASFVAQLRAGYMLGEASAVNQVAKSKTPMMFIHGTEDTFVPFYMLDIVYNAATVEKEKYVVEGAGHGGAASVAGDEYWVRVETFISKYLSA